MKKLCAVGEALIDFVPMEKGQRLKDVVTFKRVAGGAPANVAGAFCKLGGRAKMITKLGNDAFGDYIEETLREVGIETDSVIRTDDADTSLAFVSLAADGNRDFMFYRRNCSDLSLDFSELDEDVLDDCEILHFCSVSLKESPMKNTHIELIKKASEKGMIISFDPNLRFSLWENEADLKSAVKEFLPYADIIKISDEELEFITGKQKIEDALEDLFALDKCKIVVYTKGADGAEVYTKKAVAKHDGYKVDAVDTTGAGDSFIAALLYKIADFEDGLEELPEEFIYDAVKFANAYGALTTQKQGALASYANMEDTVKFMENN